MNPYEAMYYFLTLLSLTLVCGLLGVWWAGRGIRNKQHPFVPFGVALVCILPSLLFVSYYLHVFDAPWYYTLRSLPGMDGLAVLSGFGMGVFVQRFAHVLGMQLFPTGENTTKVHFRFFSGLVTCFVAVLWIALVFYKPFLTLYRGPLQNRWNGGVCLQTSPITCGPCAAASILFDYGETVTEKRLAQQAFASRSGTLNWYLARAICSYGYRVTFAAPSTLADVQAPAIIGVKLGHAGHFLVFFGKNKSTGKWIIGEPLNVGKTEISDAEFHQRYTFDHFAMTVKKR
ncbi:MAG: hypothetical protein EP343_08060 [Deltaproteobacteria bacterium]|nr:MAG: hypothetical protein EP343_08060 [Deltaproteobacteria bacterium]